MASLKAAGLFSRLVLLIMTIGAVKVMATEPSSEHQPESFELAEVPVYTKEELERIAATKEEIENFFAEDGIILKPIIGSDGKRLGWREFLMHNGQEILPGSMVVTPDLGLYISPIYDPITQKEVPDLQEGIRVENIASGSRTIYPNGVVIQKIIDPNTKKPIGVSFFGPDGQEFHPGQTVFLPDGARFVYLVY